MNNWTKIFSVIMVVAGGAMIVVAIIIDDIGLGAPGFGWKQVLLSLAGIVIIVAGFGLGAGRLPVLSRLLGSYGIYLFGIGLMLGTFTIGLAIGNSIGDDAGNTNDSFVLLHELINRDYPELENEQIDDWEKVQLLRQWTYQHVDRGTNSAVLSQEQYARFFAQDAVGAFSTFFRDEGAVKCKGIAFTLRQLYQDYGFESLMLGIGIDGIYTHAMTLVYINLNDSRILTIQDPTFDITYVNSDGIPYDYFDLLSDLKSHKHYLVNFEEGVGKSFDYIFCPGDSKYIPPDTPVVELANGCRKLKMNATVESFKQGQGNPILEAIEKDNHPPEIMYLFLYPLYIYEDYDKNTHRFIRSELEQQVRSIVNEKE